MQYCPASRQEISIKLHGVTSRMIGPYISFLYRGLVVQRNAGNEFILSMWGLGFSWIIFFRDFASYNLEVYRRFWGAFCLYIRGWRGSRAWKNSTDRGRDEVRKGNQQTVRNMQHSIKQIGRENRQNTNRGDPVEGGSIIHWNLGNHLPDYAATYTRKQQFSIYKYFIILILKLWYAHWYQHKEINCSCLYWKVDLEMEDNSSEIFRCFQREVASLRIFIIETWSRHLLSCPLSWSGFRFTALSLSLSLQFHCQVCNYLLQTYGRISESTGHRTHEPRSYNKQKEKSTQHKLFYICCMCVWTGIPFSAAWSHSERYDQPRFSQPWSWTDLSSAYNDE